MSKLYAFKQQKYNPKKADTVPDEWLWHKQTISSAERVTYEADNWIVLDTPDYEGYLVSKTLTKKLRVIPLVHEQFKTLHPSKIDFRRHLQSNVYLQKNVTMLPNGRPVKSEYYYEGVLIAEIEFIFEVNQFNFMSRRVEKLSYYKDSGEKTEQWVIADDVYDMANPYHLNEMMKERSEARASIIEGVKAFLNGVLAQFYIPQGKTYPEILEIAGEFWAVYGTPISAWINVGSPQFSNLIAIEDSFDFLDFQISEGVTVRAYVMSKVVY